MVKEIRDNNFLFSFDVKKDCRGIGSRPKPNFVKLVFFFILFLSFSSRLTPPNLSSFIFPYSCIHFTLPLVFLKSKFFHSFHSQKNDSPFHSPHIQSSKCSSTIFICFEIFILLIVIAIVRVHRFYILNG